MVCPQEGGQQADLPMLLRRRMLLTRSVHRKEAARPSFPSFLEEGCCRRGMSTGRRPQGRPSRVSSKKDAADEVCPREGGRKADLPPAAGGPRSDRTCTRPDSAMAVRRQACLAGRPSESAKHRQNTPLSARGGIGGGTPANCNPFRRRVRRNGTNPEPVPQDW